MLRSMTGYGKAEGTVGSRKYTVEVRSLNGKNLDLSVRMPSVLKEKEMELRTELGARIVQSKLNHDIEQMEWLESHFGDSLDWKAIHTRFRQVREDLYGSGNGPQEGTVLSSEHQHQIGQWYNRPLHR